MNNIDPAFIRTRKILDKNLESGNVTINKQDMVDYYSDKLQALVITNQKGDVLERYWGYGLKKLIESATQYKDKEFLLAKRHLANLGE